MPEIENIEKHSSEMQEVMGNIPNRIIRWGILVIFLIFSGLLAGSYFFKSPEVISAPLVITTINPPAPLISKSSGRIARWFVPDGENVKPGDLVALISNSVNLDDFLLVDRIIYQIDSTWINSQIADMKLPEQVVLGELQEIYHLFYRNWQDYSDYLKSSYIPRRIELLRSQFKKMEEQYQLSLEQKHIMEEEAGYIKRGLERHENLLNKGGTSPSQTDDAKTRVLRAERDFSAFLSSLKSEEINLIGQKKAILDLEEQYKKEVRNHEALISENIRKVKSQFLSWREKYLLISPVNGKITLTRFWGENHAVNAGERLATIVPSDSSVIICRATVTSSGIGKVQIGQKVNIKLAGFPYMEYGVLSGTVHSVSLVPDEKGYLVEIRLNEGMLSSYRERLSLVQEMDGIAEIITRDARLIERLIKPLRSFFDQ